MQIRAGRFEHGLQIFNDSLSLLTDIPASELSAVRVNGDLPRSKN
jgi:hypothetical protein